MKGVIKRIGALFYARTLEFVRDRAALVWNLLFPLLLVIGFSLIFSGPPQAAGADRGGGGADDGLSAPDPYPAAQAHPL